MILSKEVKLVNPYNQENSHYDCYNQITNGHHNPWLDLIRLQYCSGNNLQIWLFRGLTYNRLRSNTDAINNILTPNTR